MIAVDTNLLVYANREDSPWHVDSVRCLTSIAEADTPWAIPWPCIHEFLSVVTHPRVFDPPTSLDVALAAVEEWKRSPSVVFLAEGPAYWSTLVELARSSKVVGPRVHDARIAAICLEYEVEVLWTADRDFSRFANLSVRNPLIGGGEVHERRAPYARRRRAR